MRQTAIKFGLFAPGTLVVAVSGGADSLALLHVLSTMRDEFGIALHVASLDHGIRGEESAADVRFVADYADQIGLPCSVGYADVPALARTQRTGIEAAARHARYQFLSRVAHEVGADRIVTAHHQDDQAETILLHLLRGTGLAGLRGMGYRPLLNQPHPSNSPSLNSEREQGGKVSLIRPLLDTPRAAIEAYIALHGLTPRLDSTNADTGYLRNRLRLEIMPLLRTINPALTEALSTLAATTRDDFDLIAGLIPAYPYPRGAFRSLPISVQRMAIHQNPVRRDGLNFHDVERALAFIGKGQTGDTLTLSNGLTVALDFEHIVFAPEISFDAPGLLPGTRLDWTITDSPLSSQTVPLEHGWTARIQFGDSLPETGPFAVSFAVPVGGRVTIRTRQRGDRFCPVGMYPHSQRLSDTLSNLKVPLVWRDHIPLILVDEKIVVFMIPLIGGFSARYSDRRLFQTENTTSFLCRVTFQSDN